eukprot:3446951-Alexandrium_andersonii.AAC.1
MVKFASSFAEEWERRLLPKLASDAWCSILTEWPASDPEPPFVAEPSENSPSLGPLPSKDRRPIEHQEH